MLNAKEEIPLLVVQGRAKGPGDDEYGTVSPWTLYVC